MGSINRYYDPTTDQFLSVDPDVAITDQPYVFTNDDPLNAEDPMGTVLVSLMGAGSDEVSKPVSGHPGQISITYNAPTIYAGTPGNGVVINASVTAVGKSGPLNDVSVNVTGSQVSTNVNGQFTSFQISSAGEGGTLSGSINITGSVSFSGDGTTTDTWTYKIGGENVTVTVSIGPAPSDDDIYLDAEGAGVAAGVTLFGGLVAYFAPKLACVLLPPPLNAACALSPGP